jgi:uncharacterized protein (DUF2141 family)
LAASIRPNQTSEIQEMISLLPHKTRARLAIACSMTALVYAAPSWAGGELIVKVTGLAAPYGAVECSLFSREVGFPMDDSKAMATSAWIQGTGESTTCRFTDVAPGKYAVSVAHDTNGNRKIDTNFFGIPTEQWGVSNNVRPTLRTPKFDEAAFTFPDAPSFNIDIKVAK